MCSELSPTHFPRISKPEQNIDIPHFKCRSTSPPPSPYRTQGERKKHNQAHSTIKTYWSPELQLILAAIVFASAAAAVSAAAVSQHVVMQCEPALCKRLHHNIARNSRPCGKRPPAHSSQGGPLYSEPSWCEFLIAHQQQLIVYVVQKVLELLYYAHVKRLKLPSDHQGSPVPPPPATRRSS